MSAKPYNNDGNEKRNAHKSHCVSKGMTQTESLLNAFTTTESLCPGQNCIHPSRKVCTL